VKIICNLLRSLVGRSGPVCGVPQCILLGNDSANRGLITITARFVACICDENASCAPALIARITDALCSTRGAVQTKVITAGAAGAVRRSRATKGFASSARSRERRAPSQGKPSRYCGAHPRLASAAEIASHEGVSGIHRKAAKGCRRGRPGPSH
jgi:hypothetical protein